MSAWLTTISSYITALTSSFSTSGLPDNMFTISSMSCSGYEPSTFNISQCRFQFVTKSSTCDARYAAGLHCEGKLPTHMIITYMK